MSFSPELHMCECEKLRHSEKHHCHDFIHEVVTHKKITKSVHGSGREHKKREVQPIDHLTKNIPVLS